MHIKNFQISYVILNVFLSIIIAELLSACSFGEDARALVISGDSPLVYIKQPQNFLRNKVDENSANVGSDLYMRDISSPDSVEFNLTKVLTNGRGTVASPEVSFDGTKIVFSMLCTKDSSAFCNADKTWNIWTYDIETGVFQRVIDDFQTANLADDVDPVFLADNRIVFSSTRQQAVREKYGYVYTDEYTKKEASVLHVMYPDGSKIEQISFNRSSDFSPTILRSGKIMFSRREQVGEHLRLVIFTANPDGSDMNVLYGAHSPGDAFVQPREMQNGKVISTVIPFEGTWGGGALLEIDSVNYSDAASPGPDASGKGISGQKSATVQNIPLDKSISKLGRFTTPYPLLDGSNQVLVSFSFFQELGDIENDLVRINSIDEEEAPPLYGIYMLDMNDKSMKPIILAENGVAITDAVAVFPRSSPPNPGSENRGSDIFSGSEAEGIINIKSVYDTDQFGRMGQGVLTPFEVGRTPIPLIKPENPLTETREYVADIATIKNPLLTRADQRPARFLRVSVSIPIPPELMHEVLGETDYDMQRLIGYAPIEPDGSVKVKVPADTPLILSVLDSNGRAFEKHNNRIQVRPGETLSCNGCHSPQRSLPLNRTPIAGSHLNTSLKYSNGQISGAIAFEDETMAETRTRIDAAALELSKDVIYQDVWGDGTFGSLNNSFSYLYSSLLTPAPVNGVVHYPEHIQPIWNLPRPGGSCVTCHDGITNDENNPTGFSLNGFSELGIRMLSYNHLLVGRIVLDENGLPMTETIGGVSKLRRSLPLINAGFARGSYLVEKIFGTELFAEKMLPTNGIDHSGFLSNAEKRLIVEWIDIGAQYFNTPYDESNALRVLEPSLSYNEFASRIHRPLIDLCGRCHVINTIGGQVNTSYIDSGFKLTRDTESDFISASYMVGNSGNPKDSYLLAKPSGQLDDKHWKAGSTGVPILPADSSLYKDIEKWISDL